MKQKKLVLILFVFTFQIAKSQKVDFGLSLGLANYWGDLAPSIAWNETHGSSTIFVRYNISKNWAWNNQITSLNLSGTDKNFEFNKNRNLDFTTKVTEYTSILEFNFVKFGYGVLDDKITGYVYGGLSAFKFSPETMFGSTKVVLRDWRTENVSYSKFDFSIPFGVGVKWIFARRMSLEGQLGFRRTFTDYLDDCSANYIDISDKTVMRSYLVDRSFEATGAFKSRVGQKRGNADYNDWYIISSFSLVYRIPTRMKCARFY